MARPSIMRAHLVVPFVLAIAGSVARGQVSDTAQCRIALTAASRDSQSTRLSILFTPFDTTNRLSTAYREFLGVGILQFLKPPSPIPLHVYDPRSALGTSRSNEGSFATLTLRVAYRAYLHRDGQLTGAHPVGGTRDAAFDESVLRAIDSLDANKLLPPPTAPNVVFDGDSLDLRIVVTPDATSLLPKAVTSPPAEGVTPILRLRTPIRHLTNFVHAKPDSHGPAYPTDLRNAGIEGSTSFEFVVNPDGRVDLSSVQVLRTTAPQFVKAVLDALPSLRFDPMRVEGCAVPGIVQMPFEFNLQRP